MKEAELNQLKQKNTMLKSKVNAIQARTSKVSIQKNANGTQPEGGTRQLDGKPEGPVLVVYGYWPPRTRQTNMNEWTPTESEELWIDGFVDKTADLDFGSLDQKCVRTVATFKKLETLRTFVW